VLAEIAARAHTPSLIRWPDDVNQAKLPL
jgi:hypothetical protein